MAFSRTARKALRRNRQQPGGDLVAILREGERAALAGLPASACPYPAGSEDADIWTEGHAE